MGNVSGQAEKEPVQGRYDAPSMLLTVHKLLWFMLTPAILA